MSYGSGYNGGKTRMGTKVILNVYDLTPANDYLYSIGLGIHHSGVEILGSEYAFGSGGGIFNTSPKEVADGAVFRESISLGTFEGGSSQLRAVIDGLRSEFPPDGYNILTKNCNHFANALVWSLVGRQIPSYINRIAYIGNMFSCFIPQRLLGSAPVDGTGRGNDSSTSGFQTYGGNTTGGSGRHGRQVFRKDGDVWFDGSSGHRLGSSGNGESGGGIGKLLGGISIGGSSDRGNIDLTDRRERVRKAALARLERRAGENVGDG